MSNLERGSCFGWIRNSALGSVIYSFNSLFTRCWTCTIHCKFSVYFPFSPCMIIDILASIKWNKQAIWQCLGSRVRIWNTLDHVLFCMWGGGQWISKIPTFPIPKTKEEPHWMRPKVHLVQLWRDWWRQRLQAVMVTQPSGFGSRLPTKSRNHTSMQVSCCLLCHPPHGHWWGNLRYKKLD